MRKVVPLLIRSVYVLLITIGVLLASGAAFGEEWPNYQILQVNRSLVDPSVTGILAKLKQGETTPSAAIQDLEVPLEIIERWHSITVLRTLQGANTTYGDWVTHEVVRLQRNRIEACQAALRVERDYGYARAKPLWDVELRVYREYKKALKTADEMESFRR